MTIQFEPLQKVIWWKVDGFKPGRFVKAWVDSGKNASPFIQTDGLVQVRLTERYEDAVNGRGRFTRLDNIQPYSDDVWAAIERLCEQEDAIVEAKRQLRKGRIPDGLTQMELFG